MKNLNQETVNKTRRGILKTIAASGISIPLLQASGLITGSMIARYASAEISTPNKSVVIYVPGGAIHDRWAPSGSGSSMVMQPMSLGYDTVKTECNFLLNMSHASAGHGLLPILLKPNWNGKTYDVFMGEQLGPASPFSYVNLGVHSNGAGYITNDGNTSIPFQDNPFTAYKLLFGNTVGNTKAPILDAHAEAINAIKTKLAGYEVNRMDDHLDAISDTQRRLDELEGASTCSATPDYQEFDLDHDSFTMQANLQTDIIVAALQCGLTNSVSLAFGNHQSEFRIGGLGYQGVYHQSIHGGSNGQANYPYYTEMRNHMGSLTANLIAKLSTAGILDSTIVVETTDMGHADLHGGSDVPYLIAGGGSRINKGVTTAAGASYDNYDLLHTSAKACGVVLDFGQEIPGVIA